YAARRRHPNVSYELHDSVNGATLSGWGGGLRLLVDNLLDNAALHGRPGGRIDVALRQENGSPFVQVEDDAPGISPDEREHVLEPCARGARAAASGTGLARAALAPPGARPRRGLRRRACALGGSARRVR